MKLREEYTKYYTQHYNVNSSTGVDVDLTDPIKAFCDYFIPDNKKEYLYDFIKGLIASTS